jgi:hypothetical protein
MLSCNHEYPWLGLSLTIRSLIDALIEAVEPKDKQLLLFPIETKMRDKFALMANTFSRELGFGLDPVDWEYVGDELRAFVKRIAMDEWSPIIFDMLRISQGEPLTAEKCLTMIAFFDKLESHALSNWQHQREGCFA